MTPPSFERRGDLELSLESGAGEVLPCARAQVRMNKTQSGSEKRVTSVLGRQDRPTLASSRGRWEVQTADGGARMTPGSSVMLEDGAAL